MGLKFNESDVELFLLQQNMWQEIVKVFKPFVAFLKLYDVNQVYNMIAIMLDPWFKHLCVVENYVGWGNTICLAFEYDVKGVIPLLMVCFHQLNLIVQECSINGPSEELNEEDNNIFGVGTFIEKSSHALFTIELFLFWKLPTLQATCNDLLA